MKTPPTDPTAAASGATLAQLRRIRWAVRATLTLGVAASVAANILHADTNPISEAIAAWPPVALLLTVDLISRVPVDRRWLAVIRVAATAAIAGIAAWVSYWHMSGVTAHYGERGATPYLLPISVDGLVMVASVSLVELATRIRTLHTPHARSPVTATGAAGSRSVTSPQDAGATRGRGVSVPVRAVPPLSADVTRGPTGATRPPVSTEGAPAGRMPVARELSRWRTQDPSLSTAQLAVKVNRSERTVRRLLRQLEQQRGDNLTSTTT